MELQLMTRRDLLLALAATTVLGRGVCAQTARSPLRLVCGYPPGGSVDVVSRKLAERLAPNLQRTVLVENKPGAAGRTAVEETRRGAADSSLLVTPASVLTLYPHVYPRLSYDVFADLTPVTTVASTSFALAVGPMVPAEVKGLDGFFRWCRAHPAQAQCGNAGVGSMPHFMAMLLAKEAELPLAHVPYRGGQLAMQDAAAGQVASALATESAAMALAQAGRLRVLATSGLQPSVFFPKAPTFTSLGLPVLAQREWFGVFAPALTSSATVSDMAKAIQSALLDDDARAAWQRVGLSMEVSGPDALRAALRREYDFWGPVVKSSGFSPES